MTDEKELPGSDPVSGDDGEIEQDASKIGELAESAGPPEPREPMPPIESRFMLVDIAAQRAKQLRRGALPRIAAPTPETDGSPAPTRKIERIAVAEVDQGLIVYDIPDPGDKAKGAEAGKDS